MNKFHLITRVLKIGSNIYLYKRVPGNVSHVIASFPVSNLDEEVAVLKAEGVVFEMYEIPGAKKVGDVVSWGTNKAVWFRDPDGNILNLFEKEE